MESSGGYPEEQPERSPSGDDPRQKDSPRGDEAPGGSDDAPDNDDGTATGHPGAAGSDE